MLTNGIITPSVELINMFHKGKEGGDITRKAGARAGGGAAGGWYKHDDQNKQIANREAKLNASK